MNRLMNLYTKPLEELGHEPGMLLLTARYLDDSKVLKKTLNEALREGVVPIINANDTVDDDELKALGIYADNDNLFFRVCELVNAHIAIIGFDQKGLLDKEKKVIHQVQLSEVPAVLDRLKGRGRRKKGIRTKVKVLAQLAALGVKAKLVPGREGNAFVRAVQDFFPEKGETPKNFGTVFIP
jgi:glutamate 5-kinase